MKHYGDDEISKIIDMCVRDKENFMTGVFAGQNITVHMVKHWAQSRYTPEAAREEAAQSSEAAFIDERLANCTRGGVIDLTQLRRLVKLYKMTRADFVGKLDEAALDNVFQ